METCGDGPIELRSLLPEQLAELMQQMGEPAFRAKQIFSWCAKGAASIDEMNNLPKALRERLKQRCLLTAPVILRVSRAKRTAPSNTSSACTTATRWKACSCAMSTEPPFASPAR